MDINNFGPFHQSIWGNVSDVISAVSTVAATIGLYLTLGKQVKINGQSLETSRIEMRPHFKLTDGAKGYIKLTCENAHALNLEISKNGNLLSQDLKQTYVFKGEVIITRINFDFILINVLTTDSILLTVLFKDEIGRKYKQNILNTKPRPSISHPLLIT